MAENKDRDPLGRGWKLAGAFLAVVLVGVVIGFLIPTGGGGDDASETQPTRQPTSPETGTPSQAENPTGSETEAGGECPALSTDTAMPVEAPETSWQRHPVGMIVPTVEGHGPAQTDGEFWGCYSRTATGALLAGLGMLSNVSAGQTEATTDSPEREAFMNQHSAGGEGDTAFPTAEAFRIIMANEEEAVVEYVIDDPDATAFIRVNLAWDEADGDWRINLDGPGEPVSGGQVEDPSAFIDWR